MQRAKRILALVLAFTLVASFCVTGAAADFYTEIYSDEALGIEITASRSYDATNPLTVSFTVVVDGEPKVSNREILMPRANVSFDVEADGYDVSYDCNGAYIDAGVMTVNQDNASVTVNLTSERDSAEYVIQNASTNYGTFWWIKHNAGTSAFSRTVSIYVNGDWQYNQTVWTPTELTNGGAGDQYGFRPNQELYNVEATLSPPISLDQVANRNVSVYLTTKCPCGQSSCTCPGGSECTCSEGCTCEECVPELGDNQIDTGYGIVTYRDDGESWGIFYKLTVRVTVNGEQVFESEQFRINGSASGNLEFDVKSGHELPLDNYYTIDAYSEGASWAPSGGKLTFAGALSNDTEYDNVLTIHLYTSGNTAELDVERRPGVSEYMTGYIISYTLDGQEYTHEVDDFLAAQVPSIPLGTDVTISAVCEAPYEVSEWHHDYHSGEMTISGSEGQSGTNAYGNEITLRLNSTNIPRYVLYVEEVREVRVPTQTELENPETGLLRENAVTIDCVNSGEEHDNQTFGLISGTYNIGPLAGNSADGYTCTLTVTNAQPYVDEYNKTESGHELVAGQGNKTITLKYVAGEWTVPTDAAPVTYNVSCDNGGGEEPENPPKPDDDEIPSILGTEFRVKVECETDDNHSVSYSVVANDTDNTRYNVSSVTENAVGGYSCTVTFTNIYLNTYLANNIGHTDSDTPDDTTVRLVWDAAEEAWELDPADNTATFYVKCESGGGEPEYQTINYHIVGDVQPEDDENWTDGNMSVKVEKGTEYSFAEAPEIAGYTFDGWYENPTDIGDEGKKEQSPITVGDKKYELYGSYSANTYSLTYDGNGGSFTNEWGTHTQTNEKVPYAKQVQLYNTTYYFVREGYTCIGWSTNPDSTTAEFGGGAWVVFDDNTFPGLSSRGSVTLYAVWEKDEPTEEELIGPEGILADSVKLVCDRVDRHNCLFDLKPGTAEIGESVRGADGVLTCEVEVAVGEYLADYNTKGQGTHTLAAGEASEKTIILRFDEDQESWVSATELPIIFKVHCQPERPDGEDVAAALEGFKVWVECENDEAGHTYQRKDYTVAADDTGARYEIGEVTGDAENGYGCTVTIKPDVYVQRFGEMNGNTAHELTADSPRSFEIELVYTDTGWALAEGAPSSVTFYVECETETEPEGPEKPTVSDLNLGYVVRIECVNTENTHENDSVDFSLRTDTQISELYLEDGSWKVTVTVNGGDYLDGYASDMWSGVEHELAPGETAEKTFEAVYNGTGWTADATPAVTFWVVCETTGDEEDEPAITGFSKRLVTSEPTWADFNRLGISYPDARGVIHVDRYDSVTLLYTLTVSGEEGAEYLINDPDAMLVTFRDGVASVREPATNMNGEFTDTVPSPHTYYVVKTFSWADIRDSGGYLSNTAIVEPMDGTGGPDGGDGESTETVKVEIDGDWYPVVKPGRPSALTDEHVAYMIGYADGTVRPLSGITRAEVATIFFRLLTDEVRDEYWSQSNPYTDVAEDAWYNNAISTLVNMGIISGYSDGTFRPDAAITRAEFTKIAVSFFDYADDGYSGRFSDVSGGSWYATFVDAAADMGLIEGYGDGSFRPDAGITRAEACAIVNRTLGRAPEAGHLLPRSEMNTWSDNANSNAWYYADVQEATNSHDYEWVTYGGERIENWTAKLAERDWADLEREWSDAHDAPGGEVMS